MNQSKNPVKPRVIDGFVRTNSVPHKVAHKTKLAAAAINPKVTAGHLHKRTQRSRTLMRNAVAKPVVRFRGLDISTGKSRQQQAREARAEKITQDSKVDRFGGFVKSKKEAESLEGEVISGPSLAATQNASTSTMALPALPSLVVSASHQRLERMLDEALLQADAHKQALRRTSSLGPFKRFRVSRWLLVTLASICAMALLSVAAYERLPQFAIRVAALQSHMAASVPSYSPVGFSYAGLAKDVDGALTIRYKSNLDETQGFSIIQAPTNIDSSSVASGVVPANSQVQTSQVNGNTVYIYGPSNDAAWVNNGRLFTIKDNAGLSSDQIVKIVQGL